MRRRALRTLAERERAEAIRLMGPVQVAGATGNWKRFEAAARRQIERNRKRLS